MFVLCLPAGEGELKQLMQGQGVSLSSQFRLTYSMILNLLRVEDLKVRGGKGVWWCGVKMHQAGGWRD